MTTIAAVKKGHIISICCDSLTVFGNCKETEKYVISNSKVLKCGDCYVGYAGHPSLEDIILGQPLNSNLLDFIAKLSQNLHEHYLLNDTTCPRDSFTSIPIELICVHKDGIYEVDHQGTIRECAQFSAIGSGGAYALGAIKALYDTSRPSEQLAIVGVEAAVKFDRKTEAPVFFHSLSI